MLEHARRPRPLLRHIVGHVLRRTRLAQGRTLASVARAARVSVPYLSELERGRKEASSEVLAAICEALGIELYDLLARAGHDLGRAAAPQRRGPTGLGPSPAGDAAVDPSPPAGPRAFAGAPPVLAREVPAVPAELAGQPADPADVPADVVELLADPGTAASGQVSTPHVALTVLRGPAQPQCVLAA
jgi:transcriptional regulator with XRE-family HTH domain